MIDALYKIGTQLIGNDFSEQIKFCLEELKLKDPEKHTYYTLPICIDLDKKEVRYSPVSEYTEGDRLKYQYLKTFKGSRSKTYIAAAEKHLEWLSISLYLNDTEGSFLKYLRTNYPAIVETEFGTILEIIPKLPENEKQKIEAGAVKEYCKAQNIKLAFAYITVVCAEAGHDEETPFCNVSGFSDYVSGEYSTSEDGEARNGFCYISGEKNGDRPAFTDKYNLAKVFVTTTINYAPLFQKKHYAKQYALSSQAELFIEKTSAYLLNNVRISICGTQHVILPQFLNDVTPDIKSALTGIKTAGEFLFSRNAIANITRSIKAEIEDIFPKQPFLLHFIGFKSNGNFTTVINIISDVNKFHFEKVAETFYQYGIYFGANNGKFNLEALYHAIPVRSSKKNLALSIISALLEKRAVEAELIFECFRELILCYKHERYAGYSNIFDAKQYNFDSLMYFSVLKYFVILKSLQYLGQINNHSFKGKPMEEIEKIYEKKEFKTDEEFFRCMQLTDAQAALYYLGRMVSSIGRIQADSGHEHKPILEKINYNGMDRDNIKRLRIDLFEKAKQYKKMSKIEYLDSKFTSLFDYNSWNMKPDEALFFLLTGYSVFIKREANSKEQTTEAGE